MKCEPEDAEPHTLLDLDGLIFWPNSRYRVKFEARQVEVSEQIPHGIKYSLSLHDVNNTRIIAFDNAHAVKKSGKRRRKYSGRIVTWDHIHKREKTAIYEFESVSRLLSDFWETVDKFIK